MSSIFCKFCIFHLIDTPILACFLYISVKELIPCSFSTCFGTASSLGSTTFFRETAAHTRKIFAMYCLYNCRKSWYTRMCSHKRICMSFWQNFPSTSWKILARRQPAYGFLPCIRKILLENPHIYFMWTRASENANPFANIIPNAL